MVLLRRHLRLVRRGLAYALVSTLILVAVVLAVANQLLPLAEQHPDRVADWLSDRSGRTVRFDGVQTDWTRRGPVLTLDNLRVGEGARSFLVGDTEMLVSVYAGLLPGQPLSELRLRNVDLTLERLPDGRWQVRGLPGQQQATGDPLAALEGLGELQVIGGRLAVLAPELGIEARIPQVDMRLRVDGDRVRAGLKAFVRPGGQPLDAVLDLDRRRGNGEVYAGAPDADLADWSSLLHVAGVSVRDGSGRAMAWAKLRSHRVEQVTVDAALEDVVLAGAALDGAVPQVRYANVEARARWRQGPEGWSLHAPRLRIGDAERMQQLDGLGVAGGRKFALQAARLDAAPLVELATLSDRPTPQLRRWLRAAQPRMTLRDIEVAGTSAASMRVQARIDGLGFASVAGAPGMDGLAGRLQGSQEGFALQLDGSDPMRFDWPRAFDAPHVARLRGEIVGWPDGDGWKIATPALHVDGEGYALGARGGLAWQGDGSRPRIDLAVEVEEGSLPVAKRFWVRHVMPAPLVQWLDTALVGGRIERGRAIVSGDLDDWPFKDHNGRFEASAHIAGATLKFQPEWPAAENLEADVHFLGDGFTVEGQARIGDVHVQALRGGIDHYKGGQLLVQAEARTDASRLLALLRNSPLERQHRETFANLTASGPAAATFQLTLPIQRGAKVGIEGAIALEGAKLADRRWNVAFDAVHGRAEYSQAGFRADDLAVRHDGQPGRLSLRAGRPYVRGPGHVFEAALDASVHADELIDRAPAELAWLKPYLEGRSAWSVAVAIPEGGGGPTSLRLTSNLVGTSLGMPAPLRKPAGAALATVVEAPLPVGSGDVRVTLGQLAAVRARSQGGQTGVRVVLGPTGAVEAPPASGLIATGRAANLDALDWVALVRGDGQRASGGKGGLQLQRIDVTAQRLGLLGGVFPDARVTVAPSGAGTAVRVDGPALEGALTIPEADGAAITGRFERVHWRSAKAAGSRGAGASSAAPASTTGAPALATASSPAAKGAVDPAAIPPLSFDIDDLRVANARLGQAQLRTRPVGPGLRIERLQARTAGQRIDVTGDWTGRGASARTRLDAALASKDFGALMTGLGFGGQLGGGEGSVKLAAAWDGSPADFGLASLDGRLQVDARDGRLLEVEPGAGRVLGLLSLAELPRRLTLDFRDFFSKGFSFNTLAGTVVFADGNARSDDLRIDGPAASIEIEGVANLRTQRFDQTVEVKPKAGNLLTAVGALAGGPVGAAIGAAANAVLRKPLGEIGARTYRVTGPWREPKVEVVTREQSRVLSSAEPSG
ncbi:YhdP family protein [Lysobacter korlensis]|uniref:YhdP family protein n=1 Tax=Lysobacter korlensis TaxID=553636 RepID=A0ABV6RPU1_9GAMM